MVPFHRRLDLFLRRFWTHEKGTTAIEYTVIGTLVAGGIFLSFATYSDGVHSLFERVQLLFAENFPG